MKPTFIRPADMVYTYKHLSNYPEGLLQILGLSPNKNVDSEEIGCCSGGQIRF